LHSALSLPRLATYSGLLSEIVVCTRKDRKTVSGSQVFVYKDKPRASQRAIVDLAGGLHVNVVQYHRPRTRDLSLNLLVTGKVRA
jgi:hypothetical protein